MLRSEAALVHRIGDPQRDSKGELLMMGNDEVSGALRMQIVVDNQLSKEASTATATPLGTEHGFAVWVEFGGRCLLFDTGQGGVLAENLAALGLSASALDGVLLSHGHYDHAGGLPWVMQQAPQAELYLHPAAVSARYAVRPTGVKSIGMPQAARETVASLPASRLHRVSTPLRLGAAMGLTGSIPRREALETTGGPFFLDEQGREPDPIVDDLALWIRSSRGLVVLLGCGHSGVLNSIDEAMRQSCAESVYAVIGGFHLNAASEARLQRTVEGLRAWDPALLVPCHCTGEEATAYLAAQLGERVKRGGVGWTLSLS
ncbi:MAG: MBL fold metallo-hydrolase [Myxococcota bacterium]|nr:MBL fold metallo-hydrolase [Myxococcota bacterium]